MIYTSKVIQVGENLAVIIPHQLTKKLGWKVGTKVWIEADHQKHVLTAKTLTK